MIYALWLPATSFLVTLGAFAMIFAAYLLALRKRWVAGALAVAGAALLMRAYAASDLALHPWDERYHALVAKHLIEQPLVPTLYADPLLPYDYRDWNSNHVWLHKPPLTLWLQAASMRVFGIAEIPMRLPSVLFATASVLVTFGIGCVLFSPRAGLVAATFQAFNGLLVDLGAGRRLSDHVDTLLIFVMELGIFATLVTDRRRPRFAGVVLGAACGLACLTKSLPGLLILPIWMVIRLQSSPRTPLLRDLSVAGFVTALVALPWTIYAMSAFPLEWRHESSYTWRHMTHVVESQGGPPWWYLADMPREFGELVFVPLAFALVSVLKGTASPARRAMLSWVAVPYLLFSAMATKMPAYVMLAAPALFLIQADFWLALQQWRVAERRSWRKALLVVASVVFALLPARHLLSPTGPLEERERDPEWARDLRELNMLVGAGKAAIFNNPRPIEAMFYTPYVVYKHLPDRQQIDALRNRGYEVYVYEGRTPARGPSVKRVDGNADAPR